MGSRTCEVWAVANHRWRRIKDRLVYGHVRHVCVMTREFAQEHLADHMCSCGFTYPHQSTDND